MTLALLILGCSNYPYDTYANESTTPDEGIQTMSHNPKYFKEFNRLYSDISNATNSSSLDSQMDDAGVWRMNWELDSGDVNLVIAKQLWSILYDQYNRKDEGLRNKPGRQPAVDWIWELENHEQRLGFEISVLQELQPGQADVDTCISLIADSMDLSVKVIAADRDQIQKQVNDGFITLNPEQETLLQNSSELSKQASDWLNSHRPD